MGRVFEATHDPGQMPAQVGGLEPGTVTADEGYDSQATRAVLRWIGIDPHIRHCHGEHGSGLGTVRCVVEWAIGWLKGQRRMRVRYDRSRVIQEAWNTLAARVICFRMLTHDAQ